MEDKPRVTIAFDIFPESIYFGEQDTDYEWSLDGKMYPLIPFPNCGENKNTKYMCYTKVTTYQINKNRVRKVSNEIQSSKNL